MTTTADGAISGVVSLPTDAPAEWLSTVWVTAQPVGAGTWRSTTVDPSSGAYLLGDLATGNYRVQFSTQPAWSEGGQIVSNLISEYYDDTTIWNAAELIPVTGTTVTGVDAELAIGRSIRGTISLASDADPAWKAALRVSAMAVSGSSSGYASADPETGEYTITGLAPGEYRLQFSGQQTWTPSGPVTPNLVPEYYDNQLNYADADTVDLTTGSAQGINAELAVGRTISGTVSIPDDVPASWLASVQVQASSYDGRSAGAATASVNPETGAYLISGLPPTAHRVHFSVSPVWTDGDSFTPNLVPEYFSDTFDWASANPVDLSLGNAEGIDADLMKGRVISGTVTIPDDVDPAWLSDVAVSASSTGGQYGSTRVDGTTGEYAISGLAPAAYRVQFQAATACSAPGAPCTNLLPEYYPDARSWETSAVVDVTGADRSDIDAALEEGTTISGTVTIPSDAPPEWMRGVTVWPVDKTGSFLNGADTTVDPTTGAYTISRLPAGDHYVRFSGGSYYDGDGVVDTNLASEFYDDAKKILDAEIVSTKTADATGINAELGYGGAFSGTVDLRALRAQYAGTVPSVSVLVTDETGTTQFTGIGDPLSSDELPLFAANLSPGRYRVAVETSTWDEGQLRSTPQSAQFLRINGSTSIEVRAGDNLTGLELAAQKPTAKISGSITAAGLAPEPVDGIVGSALYYEKLGDDWVRLPGARFDTDRDGVSPFTLDVVPGTYTVGYENDFSTIDAAIGEEWWNGKPTLSAADPVQVAAQGRVTGIDGRISPADSGPTVPTEPGTFVSLDPARLLDTRVGNGAPALPVAAKQTIDLQVTGRGGVPATGVSAVVLNVTATQPTVGGFLTAYPSGTTRPTASNLNFSAGQTIPNLTTVKVGDNGKIALTNDSGGTIHLIADVAGYYLAGTR